MGGSRTGAPPPAGSRDRPSTGSRSSPACTETSASTASSCPSATTTRSRRSSAWPPKSRPPCAPRPPRIRPDTPRGCGGTGRRAALRTRWAMPLGVRVPPSAPIAGSTLSATSAGGSAAARPETPPAVVAPPPGHPRFPLLDSLRAIAVLCVLLSHTSALSGSNEGTWYGPFTTRLNVGVTIFFLISGFLIYRPFVNSRLNGAPKTPLVVFFERRFLRIFPAYWLALTVLAISPGLPDVHTGRFWVYYGLFQ